MNNATVLRTESNGVEYFTVVATGESGMSQSGLARACGVTRQSLIKLEKTLVTKLSAKTPEPASAKGLTPATKKGFALSGKAPSKWLESFVGKGLTLVTNYSNSDAKTRGVTVYTAEFCAATIKHYAYSGSKTAQQFDSQLGIIGLTSYIQSVTGWLPEKFKAAPEAHKKLSEFLNLAMEWDRGVMMVVDEEGYEVDMSDSWTFLDAVVFSGFTVEEYLQFQEETKQLGLRSEPKSEQIRLFFERNPEIVERQKPYTDRVQKMLSRGQNQFLFKMLFTEAFGSDYDEIYCELENSADTLRTYRLGYADRNELTEPRFTYSPDYMEGWNANKEEVSQIV